MKAHCTTVDEFHQKHVRPRNGRTLVVGSRVYRTRTDRRSRYKDAVGVDMQAGEGVDLVLDLEEPLLVDIGKFAHIDCVSVLEHSRRPWLLASNLESLMEPGATIYVQVPFVWRLHGYPSDYWRMTMAGVESLFFNVRWSAMQMVHGAALRRIPSMWYGDRLYFARTQVCGFGEMA